ncbi:hypothetical protein M427DRAFT_192744 [Gonapodya prolifera JEL478]|uniref:Uncharacterized protein n=1 Tax=Gonapodya prolifera (strain JEL478) TaxID=1344416 RepID=A0A139A024_GONPJ|nr:hypothetical protein M427DRAFT_192744 [Gonapodya prolifera JEL478]|eukprot:KXS09988.1 hypothetical protein M427DRAFT_192744 [Gonapodya prolifera JEL478]
MGCYRNSVPELHNHALPSYACWTIVERAISDSKRTSSLSVIARRCDIHSPRYTI